MVILEKTSTFTKSTMEFRRPNAGMRERKGMGLEASGCVLQWLLLTGQVPLSIRWKAERALTESDERERVLRSRATDL